MRGSLPDLTRLVDALASHGESLATECALAIAGKAPVGQGPGAGALRDSIHGESEATGSGITIKVTSDLPQAAFVIEGTAAHPIDPLHPKNALFWPGASHPVGHVNHPGTTANKFAEQATEEITQAIQDELPLVLAELGVS